MPVPPAAPPAAGAAGAAPAGGVCAWPVYDPAGGAGGCPDMLPVGGDWMEVLMATPWYSEQHRI